MIKSLFENKKLQLVFEKVWIDPEEALEDLEKVTGGKKPLSPTVADAQLLALMLNVLLQRFKGLDLEEEKLTTHYIAAKNNEKAALLMVWRMFGWIVIGQLGKADKIRQAFPKTFNQEESPIAYACYYVFSCVYSEKNGYYEDFIRLAQEEDDHLAKYNIESIWQRALLCLANLYRSRTLSNYNRPEDAVAAMLQVENDIKDYELSNIVSEMMLYSYIMHYENIGERSKSLAVLEELVTLTSKRKYSDIAKFGSIANLINTYSLRNRQLNADSVEYKNNKAQQLKWIKHADPLVKSSFASAATAFYYYTKAGFLTQENRLNEALPAIAKSILIFYRYNHVRFLAQAYTTAYKIYKTGAVANVDYRMAYKAARCSEQMRMMTDKYYKQVLNRRIETLELQHKLKEKELNEALLQQQIAAMNKEVQLTTLNLHEKIQVLDEIKIYVNSLKKKELETRQLINTIAKKIDSVKITEAEKATLQQKISETNQHLSKVLAERYPVLSNMEIRMCSLFQTGMTNKELAKLYGQSEKSYEQHRYRIKKKMKLDAKENLVKHLHALNI